MNTAARLQAAAPPMSVAVGALTHQLTERVIVFEELAPVAARGKTELVAAWRAVAPIARTGAVAPPRQLTPLVGRARETSELHALLESVVATCSPRAVLMVGDPGIGKTRLVQELFAEVDARPDMITWRQGRCPSFGEDTPYWAFAEVVKAHAGILDSDGAATIADKLAVIVPDAADRTWLLNRLRALVGLEAPDAEREENFTAWLRFLERLAREAPLVLVFEDLHWADEGLLAFVEFLAGRLGAVPLLLLGTSRPELLESRPGFDPNGAGLSRLQLGPLSTEETEQLVAGVLGERESPGHSVAEVATRCAGNPFFAEESARLLSDQGQDAPVPASVQAVIAARLDALPAKHKAALGDAAVVGEVFWAGAVAELGRRDRGDVEAALGALEERRFVRCARVSSLAGEREFAFTHALARDVAYGAIPRRTRAKKHARAADWIAARSSRRPEDSAEMLAHHLVTAIDLARAVGDAELVERYREPAVTALRLAGQRAMRLDVEAAERLYAKAVGLCEDGDGQRSDLLRAWGSALLYRGQTEEAKAAFEESAEGFLIAGRIGDAAMTTADLQLTMWESGDHGWRVTLDRAFDLTEEDPEGEARAVVLTSMAGAAMGRADYATALDLASQASDVYRRRGMAIPLAVEGIRAQAACGLGDTAAANGLRSMARLLKDRGSGREAAVIYANSGTFLFPFEGPRGFDLADEGIDFARSRGITFGLGLMETNQCVGLFLEGRLHEALVRFDELSESLARRDDQYALSCCLMSRAAVLVTMGRGPEALECAREALERAAAWDDPGILAGTRTEMVLALSLLGDQVQARQLLEAIASEPRIAGYQGDEDRLPALMRCAVHLGESSLIASLSAGLAPDMPLMVNVLASSRALIAEAAGDAETAAAGFASAADLWHDFGVPCEEGHALFGQGRCLAALGRTPEAAAALTEARVIFHQLGAKPALAEVESLLHRTDAASRSLGD